MTEEPLPMLPARQDQGPLVEHGGGYELDGDYRLDLDGPIDSVFEKKSFKELTEAVFQKQDHTQPDSMLTREGVEESLRVVLAERQAAGDTQPITVDFAALAVRARSEATSRAVQTQRKYEHRYAAWRAGKAPTPLSLDADETTVGTATLTKAAGLGVALFVFLLLLTTWKLALVWTWIAIAAYLLAPVWRPKTRMAWEEVKKHLNSTDKSPRK